MLFRQTNYLLCCQTLKKANIGKKPIEQLIFSRNLCPGGMPCKWKHLENVAILVAMATMQFFFWFACSIVIKVIFLRIRHHDFLRQLTLVVCLLEDHSKNSSNDRNRLHRKNLAASSKAGLI